MTLVIVALDPGDICEIELHWNSMEWAHTCSDDQADKELL